ncbi:unnamed protein product [Brachionus calyciflorus]|uniref:OTU domain-containing protein n=1 Tax=Brachionus calyciflorus TaxID=104777 RepID=A0A813QQ93_9BILA|nr:unnamed protein product [Brachionus calyciflorus]
MLNLDASRFTKQNFESFYNSSQNYTPIIYDGYNMYLTHVPKDGWCLLHSLQTSFFLNYNELLEIEDILLRLVNTLKENCMEDCVPLNFIAADNDNDNEIFSSNESVNELLKYHLIKYINEKCYHSFILDYLPQVLADIFECQITIFSLNQDNYIMNLSKSKGKKNSDKREIFILYSLEQKHFMPICSQKLTTDLYFQLESSRIVKKFNILTHCKKDKFYQKTAFLYEQNRKMLKLKPQVTFINLKTDMESFNSEDLCDIKADQASVLNEFEKSFNGHSILDERYERIFNANQEQLENFLKKVTLFNCETERIEKFVKDFKEQFKCPDDLCTFLEVVLRICSIKGMYARLELVYVHSKQDLINETYLISVPNFGVLVDEAPTKFKIVIYKKSDDDILFKCLNSLEEVLGIGWHEAKIGPIVFGTDIFKFFKPFSGDINSFYYLFAFIILLLFVPLVLSK